MSFGTGLSLGGRDKQIRNGDRDEKVCVPWAKWRYRCELVNLKNVLPSSATF